VETFGEGLVGLLEGSQSVLLAEFGDVTGSTEAILVRGLLGFSSLLRLGGA
jgi:hypothetical protein